MSNKLPLHASVVSHRYSYSIRSAQALRGEHLYIYTVPYLGMRTCMRHLESTALSLG